MTDVTVDVFFSQCGARPAIWSMLGGQIHTLSAGGKKWKGFGMRISLREKCMAKA